MLKKIASYQFTKDFKEAIQADHIRTSDEVKTLRKCLKNHAKIVVGEHHKDLGEALEDLVNAFGNTQLIWDNLKQNLDKKLGGFRNWGRPYTVERLNAINLLLDFIRQGENLAEGHSVLQQFQ